MVTPGTMATPNSVKSKPRSYKIKQGKAKSEVRVVLRKTVTFDFNTVFSIILVFLLQIFHGKRVLVLVVRREERYIANIA